jgi:RNA polymerase sigma factor (sigma-70 family)
MVEEEGFDQVDNYAMKNIETGIEGRYLVEKINELSPMNKDPVYLRFVEDLSPEEIGKILNISTNNASVRINRGLEELRKITGYK